MFEELDEPKTEIVRAPAPLSKKVQDLQDAILEKANMVTDAMQSFGEIDPQVDEVPPHWIKAFGPKEAKERYRIARYALMSAKEAPVGLKYTVQTRDSILRAKAAQRDQNPQINVQMINMPGVNLQMNMPKIVVKGEE